MEKTFCTWLIPAGLVPAELFAESSYIETMGDLVRINATVPPEQYADQLRAAGTPYHLWTRSNGLGCVAEVSVWTSGMTVPASAACDEDGYPCVRLRMRECGGVTFGGLAAGLKYLTATQAYMKKYNCDDIDDVGTPIEKPALRTAQVYCGDGLWAAKAFCLLRKGDRFRLLEDGVLLDDGEESTALGAAYLSPLTTTDSTTALDAVWTIDCDVVSKVDA